MRKLFWFAVGVCGACCIGAYLTSGLWLVVIALLLLAGTLGLFFWKHPVSEVLRRVFIGAIAGLLWFYGFSVFYLSPAREADGKILDATVRVTDYSVETDYGHRLDGRIELDGKSYKIRLYYNGEDFRPGDTLKGKVSLRYTATGGDKDPTHHAGKSIFLLGTMLQIDSAERASSVPLRYFAENLRRQISNALERVFPADTAGFAKALLLGDSSGLTQQQNNDFSESGIRHVIAVSGLHVSILFSLVYLLFGERRVMNAVFGLPLLILFAAVAGFTPSIVRACVMQCLMILSMAIKKEYDPLTALGFSVLVILAVNPLTVTAVSFQLSVGCILGILLFSQRISKYLLDKKRLGPAKGRGWIPRLKRWLAGGIAVTLSAMVLTTPLCAYYFGLVSIVGIVTNLLTLWVISLIFYGIMLAALLGTIYAPLGSLVAWCISWPIRYVLLISSLLAKIPFAAVYMENFYMMAWLAVSYVLLLVFCFSTRKRPLLLCGCISLCLMVSILFSRLEYRLPNFSVTVLDVGNGQSILLRSGREHYLVDCGGDSAGVTADKVVSTLLQRNIGSLDAIILTHYDNDHTNGLLKVLEQVQVDTLYLPDIPTDSSLPEDLERQFEGKMEWVDKNTVLPINDGQIRLYPSGDENAPNDCSMCILFQSGDYDILITGDRTFKGERSLLTENRIPKIEMLIVGHHGAASSTSLELLAAVRPQIAVISVGRGNQFGHPAEETMLRLKLYECDVWRTDIYGTLEFKG